MPSKKSQGIVIGMLGLICFFPFFYPENSLAADLPKAGVTLPAIRLECPSGKTERHYLGLRPGKTFDLEQIDSPMILIEILGVYCPECHTQMPVLNQLFNWIDRDPVRSKKVRLMALAVGATTKEIDYFKKEHRISFPVIKDQYFVIHKQLGEPRTPFTILVSKDRKVLFARQGLIENLNKFTELFKPVLK